MMLVALTLLSACQTVSYGKLFLPPSWAGLDVISEDVRVDQATTSAQREQILHMRNEARTRLAEVVGDVKSHPIHVVCVTAACYQRLGGGLPIAKSVGDMRTLLGPEGVSRTYLAHEWWHAELYHRLSFNARRKVPTWFDEGVAVWVSQEPRHGEAMYQRVLAQGIVPPAIDELETSKGWNSAVRRYGDDLWTGKSSDAVTVVYPTAGHEVSRWISHVGTAGLRALVDGLQRGQDFHTLYDTLERREQPAS